MKSFFNHPLLLLVGLVVAIVGRVQAQPSPPSVTTLPASALGTTNATLNGLGNPNGEPTAGFFQWGTTINYGNETPVQSLGGGGGNINFNQTLGGLSGGITYHFRAVASNGFYVVAGSDQSFALPAFSDINAGLPGVYSSSVAWGDYDNDGDLDFLLTGTTNGVVSGAIARIYRNNGNGTFTDINAGLVGVNDSSMAWGDYDNDGDLDILLTGQASSSTVSRIYRNNGNSTFTDIIAGLPGVRIGSVAWGDYNRDGRLDILLTGQAITNLARIYRNDGNGIFTDINASLPGVSASSVAWGDYDNDGNLDILLTGNTGSSTISYVYRNNGNGTFFASAIELMVVRLGSVAWGDYDNDGDLDILLTGQSLGNADVSRVYRNDGNDNFTDINAGLPNVSFSSAAWGDFDNDGRLDVLLAGKTTSPAVISRVYRNNGNGTFTDSNASLPGFREGALARGDFDNDGRLDILLTGTTNSAVTNAAFSQIWRNNTAQTNQPPTAPSGLNVTVSNSTVTLKWNASADSATLTSGLSYNVRIGTTPGSAGVLSPMAGSNGFRRLPALGNARPSLTATFNYVVGVPYYWSVQAVDSAWAGSPFAPESSFKFQPVQLPVTATNVTAGDLNGDGLVDQGELNTVLTNYFPTSPFLQMTNVAGLGGTNVTFALTNNLAGAFSVEYTTNLVNWLFLGPATPRYLFTDTNAPAVPQRYYRLRWP